MMQSALAWGQRRQTLPLDPGGAGSAITASLAQCSYAKNGTFGVA
jgi:hypothetical protein